MLLLMVMINIAGICHELGHHWKPLVGSLCAFLAAASTELAPGLEALGKAEDLTVKAVLAIIVWACWNGWQKSTKENTAQRDKYEAKLESIIEENTQSNNAVVVMVQRQVQYFDDLTKRVLDEHITKHGSHRRDGNG